MTLNKVLIALTCALLVPAAALAQPPAWSVAAKAECCATMTDDQSALAAAVLLPPVLTLPVDERATTLAMSVLLPRPGDAPAGACCGSMGNPAAVVDHSTHLGMPQVKPPAATAAGGCCQEMKDGCGMPCCQSIPPTR